MNRVSHHHENLILLLFIVKCSLATLCIYCGLILAGKKAKYKNYLTA
ncbi:hypothetical protein J2Z82_002923 [Virgibacillus litoralis]|uniref:Uncharacterized protein n=1 Tax=Virgibacillus litoralis TaxID=578221 RepID=A0ABS4HHT6_9BACI|nr:hypothetical protein [Virgibacillus litoralis]